MAQPKPPSDSFGIDAASTRNDPPQEKRVTEKSGGGTESSDSCRSRMLSCPDDPIFISELFCLLRSQLEVFVVSPDDVDLRFRKMAGKVDVGRVGIRCVHCTGIKPGTTAGSDSSLPSAPISRNAAVSYPKSVRLMYQSVRNWKRHHFPFCRAMPEAVKERYRELVSNEKPQRSSKASALYWEESCRRMGMIDSDTGIKLKSDRFLSDDDLRATEKGTVEPSESSETSSPPGKCKVKSPTLGVATVNKTKEDIPMPPRHDFGSHKEECCNASAKVPPDSTTCENSRDNNEGSLLANAQEDQSKRMASAVPRAQLERPSENSSANLGTAMPGTELGQTGNLPLPTGPEDDGETLTRTNITPYPAHQEKISPPLPVIPLQPSQPEKRHVRSRASGLPLPAEGNALGSSPLSKEALLKRVQLAVEAVRAVADIRPLTPLGSNVNDASDSSLPQEIDLSNLGVELYELFSGETPFFSPTGGEGNGASNGLIELFKATDAVDNTQQQQRKRERRREAAYVPLHDLGLPAALCSIVSVLMDHSVSGNNTVYQSISEVEEDLRLVATEPDRYLCQNPAGDLRMSQNNLFGRDEEMLLLQKALDQATNADANVNSMVLISGYSGTGKSSLIRGAQGTFAEKGACFVSGKFDAMMQPQPLSAIVSALDAYCSILAQDSDRIEAVRDSLSAAIGSEGAVLVGLLPNLRKILRMDGAARPIQVTGREAFQRVLFMVRMLFWATCSRTNPVVLVLDDMQWADSVSLELMQVLVTDSMIEGLLFVGSFRDNEVGADHPLMMYIDNIRRSGNASIIPIHTSNLDSSAVTSLLSNALHLLPRTTQPLAEVIMNKTGGNALFVVQFLSSLHDEGLLRFSLTLRRWEWDIDQIRNKDIADNVVELMTAKLLRLGPEVQEALSVAAAFGAACQESLLRIMDRSPDTVISTAVALDVAVAEGLMVKSDGMYRFSHDQIQRASYLLIPDSECDAFHLRIGRSLWKLSSKQEMEKYLFVVVDQLHRGSSLIADCGEKVNLAQLSFLAAQMATSMSGFLAAAAYLKAGIALLVDGDWERNRELCFDLHNSCAETEYILGDFEGMKSHLEEVLQKASTLQEKLKACYILVSSLGSQGCARDAISTATTVLSQLGAPFPAVVNKVTVKQELMKTQKLFFTKKDALDELESMVEAEKLEAMRFLRGIMNCAYAANREYYILASCRMVQLSLSYGLCSDSCFGFATYSSILCGLLNDVSGGLQLGKLTLSLVEKFECKETRTKVQLVVYGTVFPWTQPMQASLPIVKESIDITLSFGATDATLFAMATYTANAFFSGQPLGALMEEVQLHAKKMATGFTQHGAVTVQKPLRQAILNLMGQSANPIELIGEEMDEHTLELFPEESEIRPQYYFCRMWLEYLFGEYELCWQTTKSSQGTALKHGAANVYRQCNYVFFSGLAALALARIELKDDYMKTINDTMTQMEKWAAQAPWNCEHKFELMKAEYAYLQGDITEAAKAYDAAIEFAAMHSFQHEQALTLERAGIFYSKCGDHDVASGYFKRAHDCYCQWGAMSKAAHIKNMFGEKS